jgi:hypothetical protein
LEKEWEELEKEDYEDNQVTRYFDENGWVFKHEHYVNGCLDCFVVHKFDKKGNHIAMLWYNGAGRLTSRLSYLIRNNRLFEQKCFGGNGHLCWTRRYIYNQHGQVIEQNTYKRKFLFYKIITDYDKNNRKISRQKFIHKDYIQKWNMKTEELGFMLDTR